MSYAAYATRVKHTPETVAQDTKKQTPRKAVLQRNKNNRATRQVTPLHQAGLSAFHSVLDAPLSKPPLFQEDMQRMDIPLDETPSSIDAVVQRVENGGQHPVQRKEDFKYLQRTIGNQAVIQLLDRMKAAETADIHKTAATGVQGTGSQLPHLDKIQQSFGQHDISGVQAFTGTKASTASKAIGAHAYTTGSKIAFASASPDLHTTAHEATHVLQQAAGVQLNGGVGEIGDSYERHANAVAGKVVKGQPAEGLLNKSSGKLGTGTNDCSEGATGRGRQHHHETIQMINRMGVKRIANNGSLYMGTNGAFMPTLGFNGGTNWWGPQATANTYVDGGGGALWRATATRALNLINTASALQVKKAITESIRQRNALVAGQGMHANLVNALANRDFAYAIPNAIATIASAIFLYATSGPPTPPWPVAANAHTSQALVDTAVLSAGGAANIPLFVSSIIQVFAGHNGPNAVHLDNVEFLANPNGFTILRKDNAATDLTFTNALLADLNDPARWHGLHVPLNMNFGGFMGTLLEVIVSNAPVNLVFAHNPAGMGGPGVGNVAVGDPDMVLTNKNLVVDDSVLAQAWRAMGGNN